eukprot:scaffold3791_cov137-Cylindrotheca_fusiformis.AAC.22
MHPLGEGSYQDPECSHQDRIHCWIVKKPRVSLGLRTREWPRVIAICHTNTMFEGSNPFR